MTKPKKWWWMTAVALALLPVASRAYWMWRSTGQLAESPPAPAAAATAVAEGAQPPSAPAVPAAREPLRFPRREPDLTALQADSDPGSLPALLLERAARSEALGRAVESFQANDFAKASWTCQRLLKSGQAGGDGPFAQFLWAASEFQRGELNHSYDRFEELEKKFPASELGPHAARWELAIASEFLAGHKEKLLGMRIRDMRADAQVVLDRLVGRYPYGQLTDRILVRLGDCHRAVGEYSQANLYYDRLLRDFPRSPLAKQTEFSRVECLLLDCRGPAYDIGGLTDAEQGLDSFISSHPNDPLTEAARQYRRTVRELEGEHVYRVAEFYMGQRRWQAARQYFNLVRTNFADTAWAAEAGRRLEQLTAPSLTAPSVPAPLAAAPSSAAVLPAAPSPALQPPTVGSPTAPPSAPSPTAPPTTLSPAAAPPATLPAPASAEGAAP
jgi:outer membrane assembly lipoprotein YfiO